MCGSSHCTAIGWKVKQDNGYFPFIPRRIAQSHELLHPIRQAVNALQFRAHIERALGIGSIAPAEHHRTRGTIEFGDSDHHGRLDRHQPHWGITPLIETLELKGLNGQIRHIQFSQQGLGGVGVVVGGTTH